MAYATTDAAIAGVLNISTTLQTLLGAASRIVAGYPASQIAITSSLPAYVVMANQGAVTINGSGFGEDELKEIQVRAISLSVLRNVRRRIETILGLTDEYEAIDLKNIYHIDLRLMSRGPELFDDEKKEHFQNIRFSYKSIGVSQGE